MIPPEFTISNDNFLTNERLLYLFRESEAAMLGVSFCASLDFSTCLVCAALDGHVWRMPDEVEQIPILPLHGDCRCILLPVTEMDDAGIKSSTRPAAASDFWQDAANRYARKYPAKVWTSLAYSTRLKYYYAEQKSFEEKNSRPAYDQVPQTMNFSAWLRMKPEKIQNRYLGELRAKIFRRNNVDLLSFVNCETMSLFPLTALKKRFQV